MLFLLYTLLTCGWVLATFVPTFLDVTTLAVKRSPVRRTSTGERWTSSMFMLTWMAMLMDATLVLMLLCFATFHLRMAALAWLRSGHTCRLAQGRAPRRRRGRREAPRQWC